MRFVEMVNSILVDPSKPAAVFGGLNYDYWKEPNDHLRTALDKKKFAQIWHADHTR